MKLTHIFWSLLILVLLLFIPGIFYRNNSKLGGGAELLGFLLLLWLTTTISSPIMLILSRMRMIKNNLKFTFTLLAIFNVYFGIYGIYIILSEQVYRPGPFALEIFILNLVWAVLIFLKIVKGTAKSSKE